MRKVPSLKKRLTTILILATCLPVLLVGTSLLYYIEWHLQLETQKRNQQIALHLRETVRDRILDQYKILLTAVPLLQSDQLSQEDLHNFLDNTVQNAALFDAVVVLDGSNRVWRPDVAAPDLPAFASSMRAFEPTQGWPEARSFAARHDYLRIDDAFISGQTGYPTLPLALEQRDRLLVGYLNLGFIRDILDEESRGASSEITIADWHGTLIGHNNYRKVLLQQKELAEQLIERRPVSEMAFFVRETPQHEPYYESLLNLPELGWTISVRQNLHALWGPALHLRPILVATMLLSILFAILLATPTIRRLLKPMEALRLQTRHFALGDYAISIPKRSYSEVNELFESFSRLGGDLQAREKALCESKEWYQMLFESSNDAIFLTSLTDSGDFGHYVEVNQVASRLSGYSAEELLRLTPYDTSPEETWGQKGKIIHQLREEQQAVFETSILTKNGRLIPVETSSHLVHHPGHRYVLSIVRDITERKKLAEKVERMAFFDPLTGLPNRRLLMDRIEQGIAQAERNGRILALLFVDIDNFKQVNDNLGHERGDELLTQIARRLERNLRKNDTVARLSGDEFVIILNSLHTGEEAASVAQKILIDFGHPFLLDGREVSIGSSIGIAIFPQDGTDANELLRHADIAMYHAKESGRHTFRYFSQEMNRAAVEKRTLLSQMDGILGRNEFALHYQPKIDLSSEKLVGMEALLRWNNPMLGQISPHGFLSLTEETGLIVPLGAWVLNEACAACKVWQEEFGCDFTMTVNVSLVQLQQSDFTDVVRRALAASGLAAEHLELDLPESILLRNFKRYLPTLEQLQKLGVKLSLDGLGVSFAFMAQLKSISLHALKIHRDFLEGIHEQPHFARVTDALISMAHHLDLNVVAEGVEAREQFDLLRNQQCDQAQGFLIAEPLSKDLFHDYLVDLFKKT